MSPPALEQACSRIGFSLVAAPGDPVLGALLTAHDPAEVWTALRAGSPPPAPPPGLRRTALDARWSRWCGAARRAEPEPVLTRAADLGLRLVLPGGPEWPCQLDDLAESRPYALWIRGGGDLRRAALRSVAVVGSRAASEYGLHVASEMGHALALRGWSVISGGAYGVDAAAHRGAVAAGRAATVVVLPCGADLGCPRGNERLFDDVAAQGALIAELPPGTTPTRRGFLVRNRLIAALTPGTVVVEAGRRSGALNTATHAEALHRTVMAVPGPVTSALSAGCHLLLRDRQAVCVTGASEVIEQVGPIGADLARPGSRTSREQLDGLARRVLEQVPPRSGAGPAAIAAKADCDIDTALRQLGLLAAAGFVERATGGWRAVSPEGSDGEA